MTFRSHIPFLAALFWIVSAVHPPGGLAQASDLIEAAPGILSLQGVPSGGEDWDFAAFSDQGAWFGFSLPSDDEPALKGGFCGPLLMPEGRWLGVQLAGLELRDAGTGKPIVLADDREATATVFPGSLRRKISVDGLEIKLRLWFDSSHTAVLAAEVRNTRRDTCSLEFAWTGSVFPEVGLGPAGDGVLATSPDSARVLVGADRPTRPIEISGSNFRMPLAGTVTLGSGETVTVATAMTHALPGDTLVTETGLPAGHKASWHESLTRWNGYLKAVDTGQTPDYPDQIVAVKSVMTLVNNWRAPAGRMRYSCLFPSSNVWYFNGFWAWDSWKHAVGILHFDAELAKDQVRAMFAHQDSTGMIPDVVYQDASEDNWRNTKPPLAGWAVQAIYENTGDAAFVGELYPGLVAYHDFWYADRDHDRDGLCEYGSTDGTIIAARWESGMDNAVRFDETGMLENRQGAWSMDQESVDLNAYLYREKLALADLAEVLDDQEAAAGYRAEAADLKIAIQEKMFDEETGWFYDIGTGSGEFVPVQGPEGWIPLWAGVATEKQAARARETMLEPEKFNTHAPFPTVAADHPEFSDGYWRGSVWLDQVFFAIEGLRAYGYAEDADTLTFKIFRNLEGVSIPGAPLRENYHPVTGAGQNVRHFSWTAAHLLLLIPDPKP